MGLAKTAWQVTCDGIRPDGQQCDLEGGPSASTRWGAEELALADGMIEYDGRWWHDTCAQDGIVVTRKCPDCSKDSLTYFMHYTEDPKTSWWYRCECGFYDPMIGYELDL